MNSIKDFARIVFISVCGLLNFVYLTVSTFFVFSIIFGMLFRNKHAMETSAVEFFQLFSQPSGQTYNASMDSIYLIPVYLILVLLCLATAIIFLHFMLEIPKLTAVFYMNRLQDFLFINRRKTIKFFIMLLIPLLNFAFLKMFSPGKIGADLTESMILCTISHTGIFMSLFFIKTMQEKAYQPEDEKKYLKVLTANVMRLVLFILAAIFVVPPYLLYYHFETDPIWVGAFHFFLISAVVSNYRFYRENFPEILDEMIAGMDEEDA